VTSLTRDAVRSLATFKAELGPVVSVYLDVDGQRHPRPRDYEHQLTQLLRTIRDKKMARDVHRIEEWVGAGLDRSRTRGLALFSCAAHDFFEPFALPVPVRNQVAVNQTPHILQLERLLEHYERFGVVLIDRQRARILVFELGELADKSELFDQLPRHDDDKGDWDRDHVRDHATALAHQHLRRAAEVALRVHQERPLDHVILAGSEPAVRDLERELHDYLGQRIAARLKLPVTASDDQIRNAALEVEEEVQRRRDAGLVTRLRDAVGVAAGDRLGMVRPNRPPVPIGEGTGTGVAGLEAVLRALVEHRVETLLVSEGYEAPGWQCRGCGHLATVGPTCPVCRSEMARVDDVVEEAVEAALTQSCQLAVVSENADLDVMGRIGALLRF
jgi:peptide chain release factor subunit 1